jgi:hypothetical protein
MRNRFLPLIVSLLATIALFFVVDDFIHRVIVSSLLYVSWFLTLVLGSIPQLVFWAAFIVVALVIAGKSLAQRRTIRQHSQMRTAHAQGPVATWSALLERSDTQEFSRWRLARALRKLTWDVLSPDVGLNHLSSQEQAGNLGLFLPPAIQAYFEAPLPWAQRISLIQRRRRSRNRATTLDLDPEQVVAFLESRFDVLTGE